MRNPRQKRTLICIWILAALMAVCITVKLGDEFNKVVVERHQLETKVNGK